MRDANGQCGAWAELLKDVLAGQGIASSKITVYAASNPGVDGFLVKDWTFIGNGSSPGTAPYVWVLGVDAIDSPNGAPGQGNQNPPGAFYNHFIVGYNGRFYDPSYGGTFYATQWEWEDASLDGFFRDVGTTSVAKKNDPGASNVETVFV